MAIASRRLGPIALAIALATGCTTAGPAYQRPAVTLPDVFRGADGTETAAAAPSIGDAEWSTVFVDQPLHDLIATALADNYDLKIAAARILQSRALAGLARADQFPSVNAQAIVQGQRTSVGKSDGEASTGGAIQLGASVAWEPDFWGKYRRATEAARAEVLASEWGRRTVVTSLVGDVASGYFELLALDLELSIARRTLSNREESLRLTQIRESGGATSLVDVRQAEQLVEGARAAIVDLEQRTEQQENGLSVLVGHAPGPIARGRPLTDEPHMPAIPAGLPSALLERRPDIQQAEQALVAANAEIGVARAAYLPQIPLTASGGLASSALSALLSGPALAWTAAASLVQPIVDAHRRASQVALAEARRDEAMAIYQQTVRGALRDVSDALVAYQRTGERRQIQERLLTAAVDARRLADLRYQGGASSYLEVLDSDTRQFTAELDLVEAELGELTAFVDIYRSLGGGWRP